MEAIVTITFTAFMGFLFKIAYNKYENRSYFKDYHKKDAMIRNSIQYIREKTKADHVFLVKNSNGGGKPEIGSDLTSSIIVSSMNAESVSKKWQNMPVTTYYSELMNKLTQQTAFTTMTLFVKDLKKDSFLRNHLVAYKIEMVRFVQVKDTPKKFYYLRLDYKKSPNIEEREIEKNEITSNAILISGLLK